MKMSNISFVNEDSFQKGLVRGEISKSVIVMKLIKDIRRPIWTWFRKPGFKTLNTG